MLTFCKSSMRLTVWGTAIFMAGATFSRAADPGLTVPGASEASENKTGALLIYNLYTSSTAAATQDTKISLTNTSAVSAAFVRLFFVDGTSGLVSDSSVCLTAQQTTSFKASAVRPGQTGYLVALAIDNAGLPLDFNSLTGQAEVKLGSGQTGTLPAVAYTKLTATNVVSTDGSLAALFFDGLNLAGSYNRVGRVLEITEIPSSSDGSTLMILNRVGGNLGTQAATTGTITGVLFDDREFAAGFSAPGTTPQLKVELNNSFPATAPNFTTMIPSGHTGWMKLFSQSDVGYSGSVLYLASTTTEGHGNKTNTTTAPAGGVNMRALTLSAAPNYTIPVRPPTCN